MKRNRGKGGGGGGEKSKEEERGYGVMVVCWLLRFQATCWCFSGRDRLRHAATLKQKLQIKLSNTELKVANQTFFLITAKAGINSRSVPKRTP